MVRSTKATTVMENYSLSLKAYTPTTLMKTNQNSTESEVKKSENQRLTETNNTIPEMKFKTTSCCTEQAFLHVDLPLLIAP